MNKLFRGVILIMILASPSISYAHSPIIGIDSFLNGILHSLFIPAHILLILAVGLFIGQQGVRQNHAAIVAFVLATFIGLIFAWFTSYKGTELIVLGSAAVIGVFIAIHPAINLLLRTILVVISGLAIGMDSTQEAYTGRDKLFALIGSGIGIYFFFLYPMGLADSFKSYQLQNIGIRVMGSWLAASAILVLALSFATN